MSAAAGSPLDFEPRTRASRRRLAALAALSAVIWLLALAAAMIMFLERDVMITALAFTGGCFLISTFGLLLVHHARRRREARPAPLHEDPQPC